jgi:hypothetical protein
MFNWFRKPAPEPVLNDDTNFINVPFGKRITHVQVLAQGEHETLQIVLEDVPAPVTSILAQVTVER